MKNAARIQELKNIIASWNFNENGQPIGVEPSYYIAITEELESLED
jgi:hypothetical protein